MEEPPQKRANTKVLWSRFKNNDFSRRIQLILQNPIRSSRIDKILNSSNGMRDDIKSNLEKIKKNCKKYGIYEATQRQAKKIGDMHQIDGDQYVGRLWTSGIQTQYGHFHYQNMSSDIREALCPGFYEIDIKNACPTIIAHYVCHDGERRVLQPLFQYITDRDAVLDSIRNEDIGINRVIVKKAVLTALMYGNVAGDIPDLQKGFLIAHPFIRKCISAHQDLLSQFEDSYSEYHTTCIASKAKKGALYHMYHDIEAHISEAWINHLSNRFNGQHSPLLPVFDALVIPPNVLKEGETLEMLVDELKEVIKDKFDGLVLDLNIKQYSIDDDDDDGLVDDDDANGYHDWKVEFEKTHFHVRSPPSFCIVNEEDATDVQYYKRQFFKSDACAKFNPEHVERWIKCPESRTYDRVVFDPSYVGSITDYNLFLGLRASSLPPLENQDIMNLTSRVRKQVFYLSGGTSQCYKYLINFLAMRIQRPDQLPKVALGFRSVQGTGKDSFFEWFGTKIIGEKYYGQVGTVVDLFSDNFSKHHVHKMMLVISETSRNDTKSKIHALKNLITAPTVKLRNMFQSPIVIDNYIAVIMFGQDQQFIQVDDDDRRMAIFNVYSSYANDAEYFRPLFEDYDNDIVVRAFYEYLMSKDITSFNASRDRPMTTERLAMVNFNIKPFKFFLIKNLDLLYEQYRHDSPIVQALFEQGVLVFKIKKSDLKNDYYNWASENMDVRGKFEFNKGFQSDLSAMINDFRFMKNDQPFEPIGIVKMQNVEYVKIFKNELNEKLLPVQYDIAGVCKFEDIDY